MVTRTIVGLVVILAGVVVWALVSPLMNAHDRQLSDPASAGAPAPAEKR